MNTPQRGREKVAELVALLQDGRWTITGAAEAVGKSPKWAQYWFSALASAGCLQKVAKLPQPGVTPQELWRWVR
jgi:hypothetical protein